MFYHYSIEQESRADLALFCIRMTCLSKEEILGKAGIYGVNNLVEALKEGKGAIIAGLEKEKNASWPNKKPNSH